MNTFSIDFVAVSLSTIFPRWNRSPEPADYPQFKHYTRWLRDCVSVLVCSLADPSVNRISLDSLSSMDFFISESAHTYSYDLSLRTTSFYRLPFPGILSFLNQASLANSGYDVLTNNGHYTLYLSAMCVFIDE